MQLNNTNSNSIVTNVTGRTSSATSYDESDGGGDGIHILADVDDEVWDRPPQVTAIHNALKPGKHNVLRIITTTCQ